MGVQTPAELLGSEVRTLDDAKASRRVHVADLDVDTKQLVVEKGAIYPRELLDGNVVVVAEHIPSWLLMLGSHIADAANVLAWVSNESTWFRLNLRAPNVRFADSLESLMESVMVHMTTGLHLLLQGTSKFIGETAPDLFTRWSHAGPSIDTLVALVSGRCQWKTFPWSGVAWSRVRHADYGGVTVASVSIGVKNARSNVSPPSKVRRSLRGILKVTESGAHCTQPSETNPPIDQPISVNCLTAPMAIPSVFSSTGWVVRKLTPSELGSAFDLPSGLLSAFSTAVSMEPKHSMRLLTGIPMKLVQAAASVLVKESQHPPRSLPLSVPDQKTSSHPISLGKPRQLLDAIDERHATAVKSDDAPTDFDYWNRNSMLGPSDMDCSHWGIMSSAHEVVFRFLRKCMARRFSTLARESFQRYLELSYPAHDRQTPSNGPSEMQKDITAATDAILRAERATFWEWPDGSSLFFWRWHPLVHLDTRDGTPVYIRGSLPAFKRPQRMPKDEQTVEKMKEKLNKVRRRRYISPGTVLSLTNYFAVPKGEADIRMVYDLTASGLNASIWSPTFWLPQVTNVLDCAQHDSWFGDIDAGDMFLNYPLDPKIRPYAGVDVSWASPAAQRLKLLWERWTRMAMGFVSSPYITCRLFAWAMEIIKGDRLDPTNPFHWTHVVLNLPGMAGFDPSMPRVYKFNPVSGAIACDCKTFVDDSRTIGPSCELLRAATHRIETMMGYLGLQDATRKRRPESQRPGEWTGSIIMAVPDVGVFVTVSQKKWDKVKHHLEWLLSHFLSASDLPEIPLGEIETRVGFLCHLAMAYPCIFPFLKGLYMTMNSWRDDRDKDGWKMSTRCYEAFLAASGRNRSHQRPSGGSPEASSTPQAPSVVKAVPVLHEHLSALHSLFSSATPSLRLVRASSSLEVCYFFGDASGEGFGSSWWLPSSGTIQYRFGIWGSEGTGTSSNYRELRNLVDSLEEMGVGGDLEGKAIFVFTDNMVSETVAAKGSSASKPLFDLVVRLFRLEMVYRCSIDIVHVAGTRMIAQGTDGLSRGDMYEGIMRGESMLAFVPLHLSAVERHLPLLDWIRSWARELGFEPEVLDATGWFERGHDVAGSRTNCDGIWIPNYKFGTFIWVPPPAAGRIAIEELRQARHKRQKSAHVFVCPRLLWTEWKRHQFKSADLICEIPCGGAHGNSESQTSWWNWKGLCAGCSKRILPLEGIFCQNFCVARNGWTPCRFASCAKCYRDEGVFPFKVGRALGDESEYYARRQEDIDKYLVARNGDWAVSPFQCDKCWFINLYNRVPVQDSVTDKGTLAFIRRANLDMFWSREATTVKAVVGGLKEIIRRSVSKQRPIPLDEFSAWRVGDGEGMGMAITMLEKSLGKGRNDSSYVQFETCRKLRAAASNLAASTARASSARYTLRSKEGMVAHLMDVSTQTIFFERFVKGMKARMPQVSKRNKALVSEVVSEVLWRMEEELLEEETSEERRRKLTMAGGYIVATFGYSLRGNEGFWVDGDRLVAGIGVGKHSATPHVLIALLGRFKSEEGDRMHVFPLSSVTRSGIRIRAWLERVATVLRAEGKHNCPAFCDEEGYILRASDIEAIFHPILEEMQQEDRFGEFLPRGLDVREHYLCFRSFRRGAETTARNQNVDKTVIEFIHRWSESERSRGNVPGFNMLEHYAEGVQMRPTQLSFSACL